MSKRSANEGEINDNAENSKKLPLKYEFHSHPLGIRPLGNSFLDKEGSANNRRGRGLGMLAAFSDEIILDILRSLSYIDLVRLQALSKAMYVFCHHEDIWREFFLTSFQRPITIVNNWRETMLVSKLNQRDAVSSASVQQDPHASNMKFKSNIQVKDLFSDVLFYPWYCSHIPVKQNWLKRSNIDFRSNLTVEQFIAEYEEPNVPVVVMDVVTKWPAFGKWNREYLQAHCKDQLFVAGPADVTMSEIFKFSDSIVEDKPLYIFDKRYGENMPSLIADYTVPPYFSEDLFQILGDQRPDYRWIIVGPERSGSTFHIDPNGTSAWNAVLTGRKKWVMFPPSVIPPGVHPSEDGSEVATPESVCEWFINFYGGANNWKELDPQSKPRECIVEAGQVIFVPSGWWHIVLNLEESIAITQNYVCRRNMNYVLPFLRNKRDQVSGYSNCEDGDTLYERFVEAFETKFPDEVDLIQKSVGDCGIKDTKEKPPSFWNQVVEDKKENVSFSFNFD